MIEVNRWMNETPFFAHGKQTVKEVGKLMIDNRLDCLPIVDEESNLIGIVRIQDVMSSLVYEDAKDEMIENIPLEDFSTVHFKKDILEEFTFTFKDTPVVDDNGKFIGILEKQDILRAYSHYIQSLEGIDNASAILSVILESAYEGIAVVDKGGYLIEFNEAYSRFTGIDRADAIGKHVTEIIENTNLHQTVKTRIPDRSVLQNIQGQDMIVHRIPIWKNGDVVGAIGMLLFEGVTEVYRIYERLLYEKVTTEIGSKQQSLLPKKSSSMTMNRIIGDSEATADLKRSARKAAQSKATVLISGEKGTGKEMYARSIHDLCLFTSGNFYPINCGNTSTDTLKKKLFGTENEMGMLASVENGTLFLENIEHLSAELQMKLLKVLQNKSVEQLNGRGIYPLHLRLIVSTNVDLKHLVSVKQFNSSLYEKLRIFHLSIPPLRDRKDDIPILISHLSKEICYYNQVPQKTFTPAAVSAFIQYHWYENVEEMINVLEKIILSTDEREIRIEHLPEEIKEAVSETVNDFEQAADGLTLIEQIKDKRDERERKLIISVLEKAEGNKSKAAEMLGIHRTTLHKKIRKYKI